MTLQSYNFFFVLAVNRPYVALLWGTSGIAIPVIAMPKAVGQMLTPLLVVQITLIAQEFLSPASSWFVGG
jgi:hypothetical protein